MRALMKVGANRFAPADNREKTVREQDAYDRYAGDIGPV